VTAALTLYRIGARLLEPFAPILVRDRVKSGKEKPERVGERFGRTGVSRPKGPLIWMHGASVGESRLLLDLFEAIHEKRPDAQALVTTQTMTSADMIAAGAPRNVIHQMAPVDGPVAVQRFLQHWRPEAAVFAEGEIWPNMLMGLKNGRIPAALANARMTTRSLDSWKSRKASAREIFAAFHFIGAADRQTAQGLRDALGRDVAIVGNLKMAARVIPPPAEQVAAFVNAVGRPILLAASTHAGEDGFALDAFASLRASTPDALLILAPRHPDRGPAIVDEARGRGFNVQQWSKDRTPSAPGADVVVADTMGELLFWYAAAAGVYLGGATKTDVGGHNAIEAAQLGKRVFTGPHGFNFRETFEIMAQNAALVIGDTPGQLADFWHGELSARSVQRLSATMFDAFRGPFDHTIDAILAMLPPKAASDA
jgi:3-deoxy-D-manno-octulosonic-acid transferase